MKQCEQNVGKTKVQNLGRHKSGRYYARVFGNRSLGRVCARNISR